MGDPNFPASTFRCCTCGAGTCGTGACGYWCLRVLVPVALVPDALTFGGVMVLQRASARCCTVTPKSHMMSMSLSVLTARSSTAVAV